MTETAATFSHSFESGMGSHFICGKTLDFVFGSVLTKWKYRDMLAVKGRDVFLTSCC
jgi:hypothetical protein